MSHQLMSEESLTPDAPNPRPSAVARLHDYRRAKDVEPDLEPLRRQVATLIDAILAGNSPDDAEVRDELRRNIARYPGRPEKALLGHLIAMSDRQVEAG